MVRRMLGCADNGGMVGEKFRAGGTTTEGSDQGCSHSPDVTLRNVATINGELGASRWCGNSIGGNKLHGKGGITSDRKGVCPAVRLRGQH